MAGIVAWPLLPRIMRSTEAWVEGWAIPVATSETHAVVLYGRIVVAGGFIGGERGHILDPATGEWSPITDLPVALNHPGLAALDGAVYLTGGYTNDTLEALDAVLRWEPADDRWEEIARLPAPLGAHGMAALDGRLVIVGGASEGLGGPGSAEVRALDPVRGTWEELPPLADAREHLAVAAHDGAVYAIGGRAHAGDDLALGERVERLALDALVWERLSPMPTPRSGLPAVVWRDEIVTLGGERGRDVFDAVEALSLTTGEWRVLPPLPVARHGMPAAAINDRLYAIAGSTLGGGIENTTAVDILATT